MDWLVEESLTADMHDVQLEGDVVEHCHALRLSPNDYVGLLNGRGLRARCIVRDVARRSVRVEVLEVNQEPAPPDVVLCLSILDARDRLEYAIEKCTELGTTRIILVVADRSQQRTVRIDRLHQKLLAAVRQSGRAWIPTIEGPLSLQHTLERLPAYHIIVGDQQGASPHAVRMPAAVVVGPEGGFSERERMWLSESKATLWRIGSNRLRTETAAVVVTAAVVQWST